MPGSRQGVVAAIAVAAGAVLMPVAANAVLPSFTWTGGGLGTNALWTNPENWEGHTAPSGKVGTLTFPALSSAGCTGEVPPSGCYATESNVSGLEVNSLSIDNKVGYNIVGEAISVAAGGITASPSGSKTTGGTPALRVSIILAAPQTWTIDGGGLQAGFGLSGSASDTLHIAFSNSGYLTIEHDNEISNAVGAVTVTGQGTLVVGNALSKGMLNGSNGEPVSLGAGVKLSANGTIGPLTATEGNLIEVGQIGFAGGALAVDGGVTLGSATELQMFIDQSGTVAGTDYAQLAATGPVKLAGAHLSLGSQTSCPTLHTGDVDTLVTTTGALTGTFANAADGTRLKLKCFGAEPMVRINYTEHTVTATVEAKEEEEEEVAAEKHAEEETAAKKHAEEETAAKKHAEEETAAKKKHEEGAQIVALLAGLRPAGKTAKIAALLKSGIFTVKFKALEAGTAVIDWYQVPLGAKLAKKTKAKPFLVASGRLAFAAAGSARMKIKLTSAGRGLLKHAKQLKLTAKGTFTAPGKTPITATRTFILKR